MVSKRETLARVQDYFTFTKQELIGLVVAVLLVGFIFSFRDWGEDAFNFVIGLKNFILTIAAAGIVIIFRFACQKVYGLAEGYKVSFKPWWGGYVIALVLAFVTRGYVPLVLIGTSGAAFISKHRMGEYRYGYSYWNQGIIGMWALYASIIIAALFSFAQYIFPESYFFHQGVVISLVMGFCALLPIPDAEAYAIYYATPWLYTLAILMMLAASLL